MLQPMGERIYLCSREICLPVARSLSFFQIIKVAGVFFSAVLFSRRLLLLVGRARASAARITTYTHNHAALLWCTFYTFSLVYVRAGRTCKSNIRFNLKWEFCVRSNNTYVHTDCSERERESYVHKWRPEKYSAASLFSDFCHFYILSARERADSQHTNFAKTCRTNHSWVKTNGKFICALVFRK